MALNRYLAPMKKNGWAFLKKLACYVPCLILMVANEDSFLKLASCLFFVLVNNKVGIQISRISLGVNVFMFSSDFKSSYAKRESVHVTVNFSYMA